MENEIKLVGIGHKDVPFFWPFLKGWVKQGAPKQKDLTELLREVLNREKQLWALQNDSGFTGAGITSITQDFDSNGLVCWVYALGGKDILPSIPFLLRKIEMWAKNQQAIAIRLRGRQGWFRLVPDLEIRKAPSGFTYMEKLI